MALTFGFYDSLNHDRLYNAQQMSAIFDGIINDGVFASVGSHFSVVPGTGMHVLVKSGRAWFNSTWTLNDSDIDLTIDAADTLLGRIDTVVLEVNSEQATRANSIKVVKGTAASSPVKPTLTNTVTVHQHPLAHITVAKNTTAITASMIEIMVGKTDCPFVTAILQTTDITNLFAKWENDFQTWFSTVRSTLDGDVALNLQNQIDANWRKTLRETTPPKIGLARTATPADMFDVLADVGNLHVWRKTVTTSEEIPAVPAGYTLGDVETNVILAGTNVTGSDYYRSVTIVTGTSISVNNFGTVTLTGTGGSGAYGVNFNTFSVPELAGKFVRVQYYIQTYSDVYMTSDVWFVPSDASVLRHKGDGTTYVYDIYIDKAQKVNANAYIPAVPAGTVTTYPVSTSANAYQEKKTTEGTIDASSHLSEILVQPNDYIFSANGTNGGIDVKYSSSITVSTGSITLNDPQTITMPYGKFYEGSDQLTIFLNAVRGKYISVSNNGSGYRYSVRSNTIYYIGEDCNFSTKEIYNVYPYAYNILVDKAQICIYDEGVEAGTSIEYLNLLGDKTSRQILSYTGVGTYGDSFPTKITFIFKPKIIYIAASSSSWDTGMSTTARFPLLWVYPGGICLPNSITGVNMSVDGSTATIVSNSEGTQCNISGVTYYAFAIG